ncbi:hypothetical protein ACT4UT_07275, partial [Bacillus sp. B-TM1]
GKTTNICCGFTATCVVFVNDPELLHFSYERFLKNRLRESFGFVGTPIHIIARARD